ALGGGGVRGLVTTGPAVAPVLVRGCCEVAVVSWAPHAGVLPHAFLVAPPGGPATVITGGAAHRPMVVMPHGRDQGDNARRLTERGAAVALSRGSSSEKIAEAIRRVLDGEGYSRAAAHLGEQVRSAASSGALADEVENLPNLR
ncbi:glycosyltransferase, partial [Pseudactinotalea sp.]|uniref:glycosyltransferase n=1 Tax=Pseudactinotalea sp. TaxID=1926260 RepID=UPI003B3AE5A8